MYDLGQFVVPCICLCLCLVAGLEADEGNGAGQIADKASPPERTQGRRIDFVLASPRLAERCLRADVINEEATDWLSDHYPVTADFNLAGADDYGPQAMRVVAFNVLEGFTNSPERADAVAAWLKKQDPSVVALEELNGFTPERLAREAAKWGHPYVALLKEDGYSTGLTSRQPLSDVSRVREGCWHGLLTGKTQGIRFYVVHLAPGDRAPLRASEAQLILDAIGDVRDAAKQVIVLGDFNSQSAADQSFYKHREIDGTVIKLFEAAGLRDVVLEQRADGAYVPSCTTPLYHTYTPVVH